MLITKLDDDVKKLVKRVEALEKTKDCFQVGNVVRLTDTNDITVLEVTRVTAKSVWVRHGNNQPFLKRKTNVKKIGIRDYD